MSIGKNIKRLRESRGLTQAELGKIAGVTDKAVSTWENGSADPRMGAIQRMADYFGVRKCDIIDDEPASTSYELSAEEIHLVEMFRILNSTGRRKVLEDVRDMTELDRYIKITSSESLAV